MKDALIIYLPILLVGAAAALPAALANWAPWEIALLVGIVGVVAAAWAWYALQVRRAELAALSSDDQAARLLGESLAQCGLLPTAVVKEVWDAFTTLPSEGKRSLALAVTGFVSNLDEPHAAGENIIAIARGFRGTPPPDPLPTSDEQASRVLGEALGRAAGYFDEGVSREVWEVFAALSGEPKRAMAAAVTGFLSTVQLGEVPALGAMVLELVHSFRPENSLDELLTPDTHAAAAP
jgi:hypothetical protein